MSSIFTDFNKILDNHIDVSEKVLIKKKTKKIIASITPDKDGIEIKQDLNESKIKQDENICHSYKTLEYRTHNHNKYKKNRTKKLDCEIIHNFLELENKIFENNNEIESRPKQWNKVDKHIQIKLINNFINNIVENNKIAYEIVKKKVDLALFTGKKIIYDNENCNVVGFKNVEF